MFDFIEETNSAKTPEEVFSLFLDAVARLGFDRVMYSNLTRRENLPKSPTAAVSIMRNYPDEWVAHYVEAGYVESDPVRRLARRMRGPFTWQQTIESGYFNKRELRVFGEATSAGLHDGVAIPFHGPNGEVMGVGLASSVGGIDANRQLNRLNILGSNFISPTRVSLSRCKYRLRFASPRENMRFLNGVLPVRRPGRLAKSSVRRKKQSNGT